MYWVGAPKVLVDGHWLPARFRSSTRAVGEEGMPTELISFEAEECSRPTVSLSALQAQRTHKGEPIPFPEREDLEHDDTS